MSLRVALMLLTTCCCHAYRYFPTKMGFAAASNSREHILLKASYENNYGKVVSWTRNGTTEEMNLFGVEPLLSYTTVSVCNILDTEYFYMIAQTSYGEMMMRVYGKDPTSFSIALSEPRLRNWIKVASSEKQSAVSVYTKHSLPGEQPSPGGIFIQFHRPLHVHISETNSNRKFDAENHEFAYQPNICGIGAARYIVLWGQLGMTGIYASITDVWGNVMYSKKPYKIDSEGTGSSTPACAYLHDKDRVIISYVIKETGVAEAGMYLRARMYSGFETNEAFDHFIPRGDYYPMADNQFQPYETSFSAYTKRTVHGVQNIVPSLIACGNGFAISWVTNFGVFVQSYGILEERIIFDSFDVELSWARVIDAKRDHQGYLIPSALVDLSQSPPPVGPPRKGQVNLMWAVTYWDAHSYWNLPGEWYAGGWVAVEWPENADYTVPGLFETIEVPSPDGPRGVRVDVGVTTGENSIVVYWKEIFTNRDGEEDYEFYWQLFDEHMVPRKVETQKVRFQMKGADYEFISPFFPCRKLYGGRCQGKADFKWYKPETLTVGKCHNGFILAGRTTRFNTLGRSVLWYQGYEWTGRMMNQDLNFDLSDYYWHPWNVRIVMPAHSYPETHIYYLQNTTLDSWMSNWLTVRMFQVRLDGDLYRNPVLSKPFVAATDIRGFDVATHPKDIDLVFACITVQYGWAFRYNPVLDSKKHIGMIGDTRIEDIRVEFQYEKLLVYSMKLDSSLFDVAWWLPKGKLQYVGRSKDSREMRSPRFSDIRYTSKNAVYPLVPLYPDQTALFTEFNGSCCADDFSIYDNPNGFHATWKAAVVNLAHDKFNPDATIVGKYTGVWLSKHRQPNNDTFPPSYNMYPASTKNSQLGLICAWTEPVPGGNSIFLHAVGADPNHISGLNLSSYGRATPVPPVVITESPDILVIGDSGTYVLSAPPGEDWWSKFTDVPGFPTRPPDVPWLPAEILRGVYYDYARPGSGLLLTPGYPAPQTAPPPLSAPVPGSP